MPQKLPFTTLDEFIAYAENYARFGLKEGREITATFMILAGNGSLVVLPAHTEDVRNKTESATVAKLLCIAHAATAVLLVAEAWMSAKATETEKPSEASDKQEIVIISGEGFGTRKQKMLPILRDESEKFSRFGEATVTEAAEGRFTHILPDQPVTPEAQADARKLLGAMKIQGPTRYISQLSWLNLYD